MDPKNLILGHIMEGNFFLLRIQSWIFFIDINAPMTKLRMLDKFTLYFILCKVWKPC